jgi:predicted RNA-binding protein with PUA-like domain
MNHWLIKSEPDVFSIGDLAKAKRYRQVPALKFTPNREIP